MQPFIKIEPRVCTLVLFIIIIIIVTLLLYGISIVMKLGLKLAVSNLQSSDDLDSTDCILLQCNNLITIAPVIHTYRINSNLTTGEKNYFGCCP